MKASSIIISAIFALQVSFLFAANAGEPVISGSTNKTVAKISLAPATPSEATFEDFTRTSDFSSLAPTTPAEADFNDEVPTPEINIKAVAPVTPAEASFDDENEPIPAVISLALTTPAEAEFE